MYDEENPAHVERCRSLNDRLRTNLSQSIAGKDKVMLTAGICGMGEDFVAKALTAVREFSDFNEDNDPYGEHDMIFVTVDGVKVMGKIDYYDNDMLYHSPDKSDPAVTKRVLTIMLSSEY